MTDSTERPLVSIGISTYNRADGYLREALESAIAQTYPNLEIIVSDNASTDHTAEYVTGLQDPRIRFFKQEENLGANGNFNFCLQQAQGAYFLLLHDDDILDADFIESCMDAANDVTSYGVIRTGVRVIDENGRVKFQQPNNVKDASTTGMILGWFKGETPIYFCTSLFNCQYLKDMGGIQSLHDLVQDGIAVTKLAAQYGRVDIVEAKASFRRHGSNRGSSVRLKAWCEDSLELLNTMCEAVPEDKALIRKEGLRFFTRQNYTRAFRFGLRSPGQFWRIYQYFGYSYSPVHFYYRKFIQQRFARIKKQQAYDPA